MASRPEKRAAASHANSAIRIQARESKEVARESNKQHVKRVRQVRQEQIPAENVLVGDVVSVTVEIPVEADDVLTATERPLSPAREHSTVLRSISIVSIHATAHEPVDQAVTSSRSTTTPTEITGSTPHAPPQEAEDQSKASRNATTTATSLPVDATSIITLQDYYSFSPLDFYRNSELDSEKLARHLTSQERRGLAGTRALVFQHMMFRQLSDKLPRDQQGNPKLTSILNQPNLFEKCDKVFALRTCVQKQAHKQFEFSVKKAIYMATGEDFRHDPDGFRAKMMDLELGMPDCNRKTPDTNTKLDKGFWSLCIHTRPITVQAFKNMMGGEGWVKKPREQNRNPKRLRESSVNQLVGKKSRDEQHVETRLDPDQDANVSGNVLESTQTAQEIEDINAEAERNSDGWPTCERKLDKKSYQLRCLSEILLSKLIIKHK
jgi:hypothetical protein